MLPLCGQQSFPPPKSLLPIVSIVLACGGRSSLDMKTVGAGGIVSSGGVTAGTHATSSVISTGGAIATGGAYSPGGASATGTTCDDLLQAIARTYTDIVSANQSCRSDSDCVVVWNAAPCLGGCGQPINRAALAGAYSPEFCASVQSEGCAVPSVNCNDCTGTICDIATGSCRCNFGGTGGTAGAGGNTSTGGTTATGGTIAAGGTTSTKLAAKAVAAGYEHTCALLDDGILQCWGSNAYGELGNGYTTNSSVPVQGLGHQQSRSRASRMRPQLLLANTTLVHC